MPHKKQFLSIISLLVFLCSYSQELVTTAIYFSEKDRPYQLEQKYIGDNYTLYIRHNNEKSVGIKRTISQKLDSTIIEVAYYDIYNSETKLDKFRKSNSWTTSSTPNGDTLSYGFYYWGEYLGDTTFYGEEIPELKELMKQIKRVRVPAILKGELKISLDALVPQEGFRAYYYNGWIVKKENFNAKLENFGITHCAITDSTILCKNYWLDPFMYYQEELITWNIDRSKLSWYSNRFE